MSAPRWMRAALALVVLGPASVAFAPTATPAVLPVAKSDASGAFSQTREITREFTNNGEIKVEDSRKVTVKVSQTRQLRGRERVRISWSGARPSGGRSSSPFGDKGLGQEYPVVILQCRGVDNASLPQSQRLRPETCWTSSRMQRTQSVVKRNAVWMHDAFLSEEERAQLKSGLDPEKIKTECATDIGSFATKVTPFETRDGTVYASCDEDTMGPEAGVDSSFPAAEQAAFTDLNGNGSTMFEVRSETENESLGCSDKVACSIVVIPIMGISCVDADSVCRRTGRFKPGTSNFANEGVDAAVSPAYWWAASNWRNRFSVPITFGLPPDVCNVLDKRAPTAFFGSELLSQAALQWAPAYCLAKDRFKWQMNRMPDDAAFNLMEAGEAAAAEVSGPRTSRGKDPIGYAPTAVTGFGVSYVIDLPDNKGEFTDLRLNARLLAKLLTQSYPASARGQLHEGLEKNPVSINLDPEFTALNPGLVDKSFEAAATIMSLSTSSDVIQSLTEYIAADPDAMAFIAGKPDQHGMTVNPSFKNVELPTSQWPILDTFVPPSEQECHKDNPSPYLPLVAAPVNNLRHIAEAILDAWPNVQTRCDRSLPTDPWKLGRIERQGMGSRFLLGITTLGDSARYGLRTARLKVGKNAYVGPTQAGLSAAIKLAEPTGKTTPFSLKQGDVRKTTTAYPGTMVIYTAARLRGMEKSEAAKVADFIDTATSEGQVRGRGNGQLPEGYLPLRRTGVTAALLEQAQRVSKAIRAQREPAAAKPPETKPTPAASTPPTSSVPVPPASTDPVVAAPAAPAGPVASVPVSSGLKTQPLTSRMGDLLLPILLGIALIGGVASLGGRLALRARGVR